MSFMKPEVVNGKFWEIETNHETVLVPSEYADLSEATAELNDHGDTMTVTVREGFFCRLSASGYLDCTEWSGPYETEEEAMEALVDMYGEDDDENDDD